VVGTASSVPASGKEAGEGSSASGALHRGLVGLVEAARLAGVAGGGVEPAADEVLAFSAVKVGDILDTVTGSPESAKEADTGGTDALASCSDPVRSAALSSAMPVPASPAWSGASALASDLVSAFFRTTVSA
jgi:hypothetical protein